MKIFTSKGKSGKWEYVEIDGVKYYKERKVLKHGSIRNVHDDVNIVVEENTDILFEKTETTHGDLNIYIASGTGR